MRRRDVNVKIFNYSSLKDDDFDDNVELIMLLLVLESCVLLDISDDDGDDKLLDMKPLLLLNSGGLLVLELRKMNRLFHKINRVFHLPQRCRY